MYRANQPNDCKRSQLHSSYDEIIWKDWDTHSAKRMWLLRTRGPRRIRPSIDPRPPGSRDLQKTIFNTTWWCFVLSMSINANNNKLLVVHVFFCSRLPLRNAHVMVALDVLWSSAPCKWDASAAPFILPSMMPNCGPITSRSHGGSQQAPSWQILCMFSAENGHPQNALLLLLASTDSHFNTGIKLWQWWPQSITTTATNMPSFLLIAMSFRIAG